MAQHSSSDGVLRIVLIIVALVVLLPFLMMALFMPFMWGMGGWGMMGDWGGGMVGGTGGIWGWGMLLVWLLVLGGIGYLVYRWAARTTPASQDPALEELRMQYAQGELTDEEFEERRQRLSREN